MDSKGMGGVEDPHGTPKHSNSRPLGANKTQINSLGAIVKSRAGAE